ncbi:hypothetical protein [Polycyclovorans algicola]|uniref:hypothetical protein n=1 Tax=Polycyclovorans algicola TaxID=616992 RepID=UPI0013776A5F|nr:hypothetical protein [Polycyclovorans algicola]
MASPAKMRQPPRPADSTVAEPESFYGLRPFPSRGVVVTNEMIDQLRDKLGS